MVAWCLDVGQEPILVGESSADLDASRGRRGFCAFCAFCVMHKKRNAKGDKPPSKVTQTGWALDDRGVLTQARRLAETTEVRSVDPGETPREPRSPRSGRRRSRERDRVFAGVVAQFQHAVETLRSRRRPFDFGPDQLTRDDEPDDGGQAASGVRRRYLVERRLVGPWASSR